MGILEKTHGKIDKPKKGGYKGREKNKTNRRFPNDP